jgi:predicted cupin superfamily sugar epimerase
MHAEHVVRLLELIPHPEGGYYRETFRDSANVDGRACSTAIYYLLKEGQVSRWHRIDAAEVWHWYCGAPIELRIAAGNGPAETFRLGPALTAGERPQVIVPAGHWQSARSLGSWTLAGCTVAPGFSFTGFELADAGFSPAES